MKPDPLLSTVLSLALLLPAAAGAQEVWRCGVDGRSYSATPCADGRRVEVPEARPAADIAAARDAARREAALAGAQQRERTRIEAQQRGNGLGGFAAAPPPVKTTQVVLARKPAKRYHPGETGTWRAVVPVSRRKQG